VDSGLKVFQGKLLQHIDALCCQIDSHNNASEWGQPMKMSDWFSYLIFDITTDFLFAINYDLIGTVDYRHIVQSIKDHSLRNALLAYLPGLTFGRLDKRLFKESVKGTRVFWKWMLRSLREREKREAQDDVYYHLSASKSGLSDSPLTSEEIRSDMGLLVIAGECHCH
jgi:cytochrome P450